MPPLNATEGVGVKGLAGEEVRHCIDRRREGFAKGRREDVNRSVRVMTRPRRRGPRYEIYGGKPERKEEI